MVEHALATGLSKVRGLVDRALLSPERVDKPIVAKS
jgi:hypothetical protein